MSEPTTSLAAETKALSEAHAALNRNDVAGFVAIFDPQIEWIEFADSPGGGTYRGIDALRAHVAKSRASWAEGSCQPQRIIVAPGNVAPQNLAGDRIIQIVHVRVRLKHETEWR